MKTYQSNVFIECQNKHYALADIHFNSENISNVFIKCLNNVILADIHFNSEDVSNVFVKC